VVSIVKGDFTNTIVTRGKVSVILVFKKKKRESSFLNKKQPKKQDCLRNVLIPREIVIYTGVPIYKGINDRFWLLLFYEK